MINMNLDFGKYYEAPEPGRSERAHAWATAIGLQDVDGLKPSKYLLATAKRHIEGEISQEDARRLIDEYYETKLGHDEPESAEEADKVSARMIAIINTPVADAVTGLHRQNGAANVGINVGINFTRSEEKAIKALLRNPKLTAPKLGELLDMTSRQAERIIASLKKKAGLKRRGARKNGEWCFDENAELRNDGALAVAKRGKRKGA